MRRLVFLVAVVIGLVAVACQPNPVPPDALARWEHRLSDVTPSGPPLLHALLNEAIRTGMPIACPIIVGQAEPGYRAFIQGSCNAIAKSNDPYTSLVTVLPALCAGDPPVGALAFPKLAVAIEAGCPLLVQLGPLLNIFQDHAPAARGPAPV
jgi:hypothetical protein